ncbi:FKBP-type peptidyl-prolyl cis-trans isomerase [Mucilaginibacter sp. AK015]|uniref:FKBP-type peptidyl-prolyl cis-trans isomerase n=1 Tax=Mucilaginibacter sp. AK015 TaxID=2723072 RepID=UPI00160DD8A4|nr:FKBP-type peptidyl-prolyl cis-trans isomerase [Mucilaginibacter sp. AK015]MBB5396499.1 FKBP-type peptidyl-prolyl cis-trans isomerase [Mucilaginibacter sp. AK015]
MRKNLTIIAIAALGLASCKGGFKQTEGGLLYNIRTDKSGPTVKPGDFISLNLTLKNEGDSVLGSTYEQGRPAPQIVEKTTRKGDVTSVFPLLSEGDSVTVKVNIDSTFKKGGPRPPGLKGKYIIYEIKVEKVIARGNTTEAVFNAHITDYFKAQADQMKKQEPAKIKKYVEEKKLNVKTTPSGLQYQITQQGSGPMLVVGDTAVVNYTGSLVDGKVFDTSIKEEAMKNKRIFNPNRKYEPFKFPVGAGAVIRGWDEGFQLLNKGSKATFVIPSELGWGEQGSQGMIPAFAPVIFTVEVLDIIKPNPNAPKPVQPTVPALR